MRIVLLGCLVAIVAPVPATAQEKVGVSQQAQTVAPSVSLDRPQPPSCGAAPSVAQINRLVPVVRRMFPQPRAFDDNLTAEIHSNCQRNRASAYLVKVIAANNWAFRPVPGMAPGYPPGPIACGVAARGADLNAVIDKLRPLFADVRQFNANIAGIGAQPCADARATLYLFGVMTANNVAFR